MTLSWCGSHRKIKTSGVISFRIIGTEILENIPDENARVKVCADHKYRRYTFLKRKGVGYCFVGVFEWDSEKSTHDYTIYKRVAESLP